jgi:hypothetical protein
MAVTLCVGMQYQTLRVLAHSSPIQNDAERLGLHSHAERGNDKNQLYLSTNIARIKVMSLRSSFFIA